jgi:hypothetical protein
MIFGGLGIFAGAGMAHLVYKQVFLSHLDEYLASEAIMFYTLMG